MFKRYLHFGFYVMFLAGCSTTLSSPPSLGTDTTVVPSVSPVIVPKIPHQVALLLPQSGDYANAAKAIQTGFNDAYQSNNNKPTVKVYDTTQNISINTLYDQAVKEGADFIVGPLEKANVATLQQRTDVPVISMALNTTEATTASPHFYQFALSPVDEVNQVADKAAQEGHHSALMIVPAGAWGAGISTALQARWAADGGVVVGSVALSAENNLTEAMRRLLQVSGKGRRQDFDVVFLITQPALARQIKPLLKFYYASQIPVYSTSLVYSGLVNSSVDQDLDGITFCDMPLILDQQGQWQEVRQQLTLNQPMLLQQYIRLYALGWDAALLTQQFSQLADHVHGATGELYADKMQHILRHLSWAVFVNGQPAVI